MSNRNYISRSPKETIAFAKKFAKGLRSGAVLEFSGDLGSGKTTFIKGLALGLGLKDEDEVKSPTFVLMHIYPARIPIYHFDLYRLDTEKDIESVGLEGCLQDRSAITCVEWADKAPRFFPKDSLKINFQHAGRDCRKIVIEDGTKHEKRKKR